MAYVIMNRQSGNIYGRGIKSWREGTVYRDIDDVKKAIIINIFSQSCDKDYFEYIVSKYENLTIYNIFTQEQIDLLDYIRQMFDDPKINWTICKRCRKLKHIKKQTLEYICPDCENRMED